MKKSIRLYRHYIAINIRSMMQFKSSFVLTMIGQFLVSFNVFLGIYYMFKRFPSVRGYSYSEVILCFAIMLMEVSMAELVASGFDSFAGMVRRGEFDRVMVRPQNEILQVLGSKFNLSKLGRILQAVVMFAYGIVASDIDWSIDKIMTVFFMIVGGTVLFSGLFLIYAALCFFTLDGLEFMNVFTDGAREFGRYPVGIYGKRMLQFCTFIIPYALVQYYPLQYLLNRTTNVGYVFMPLIAIVFFLPCYLLWRCGVRHYKSSGS